MESTLTVVGYSRVSTTDQADDGFGLAAQEKAIRQECQARSWSLVSMESDRGKSGKTLDRPVLHSALETVASGQAAGLVVAKLDRLSRSVADFASLLSWFSESERTFIALDVGIDTTTPGGRLVANVFASVAAWEGEVISARTREGLSAARAAGRPISRPALADNQALSEKILALRSGGLTLQQVADALNAEGIPTLRGGKTWRPSSIQSVVGPKRRPSRKRTMDLPHAVAID